MSPGGLLDTKEPLRCFVHVASDQHLCVRVRTLAVYAEINKMVGGDMDEAITLKILPIVCHSSMPQILSYNALYYSYYSMLSLITLHSLATQVNVTIMHRN